MKNMRALALPAGLVLLGFGLGVATAQKGSVVDSFRTLSPKEAGQQALAQAERLAQDEGSWERIAIGRLHYLSGDKARGQAIFDRITAKKPEASDWQRIGEVYAEAGENAKAEECFQKLLSMNPKDDTGQSEIGAWYIRNGQRAKGEELFARAFARNPEDIWHYARAAEAYLGLPKGR